MALHKDSDACSHFIYDDNHDGEVLFLLLWGKTNGEYVSRLYDALQARRAEYELAASQGFLEACDFVDEVEEEL